MLSRDDALVLFRVLLEEVLAKRLDFDSAHRGADREWLIAWQARAQQVLDLSAESEE